MTYRIFGSELSPYSVKVRSYFRLKGLPHEWIARMTNSIATLAARFSAHRMVTDYVQKAYLVAAGGVSSDMSVR